MPLSRRILPLVFRLARISRPHLVTYSLGAAFLGAFAASPDLGFLANPWMLAFGAWLAMPAGWLVYGINDAFDGEADAANARKNGLEQPSPFSRAGTLRLAVFAAALYLPIVAHLPGAVSIAVAVAAISTYLYSAPPLRAKGIPVLDGLLYLAPPVFAAAGYAAVAGLFPPWPAFVLAWAFSFAMHLYSASVDVDADRAAGLRTVAVWLGAPRKSVLAAAALCVFLAAACASLGGYRWALGALAYAIFFFGSLAASRRPGFDAAAWYAAFVALHFPVGFALTAGAL